MEPIAVLLNITNPFKNCLGIEFDRTVPGSFNNPLSVPVKTFLSTKACKCGNCEHCEAIYFELLHKRS